MISKRCPRCQETKPLTEFNKRRGDKTSSYCRVCSREYKKQWNVGRPPIDIETRRIYWRTHAYGLTRAEQEALIHECAICGSIEQLCFDHDHNTGEFRGILCRNHNLGVSYFDDDSELLGKAIEYLRDHEYRSGG